VYIDYLKSYSEQSEHERSELLAKQVTHAVSVSLLTERIGTMLVLAFFILQFTKSYSEQSEHERSELQLL